MTWAITCRNNRTSQVAVYGAEAAYEDDAVLEALHYCFYTLKWNSVTALTWERRVHEEAA